MNLSSASIVATILALPFALPLVVANDCGDIAVFSRNSANPVGINTNAAFCAAGEIDALPTLLNPGSDLVKVRYLTGTFDPEAPTVLVVLTGLGFEGQSFEASRVSFATGPDGYDTNDVELPDGIASSGELTAAVYNVSDGALLGSVTYTTADAIVEVEG